MRKCFSIAGVSLLALTTLLRVPAAAAQNQPVSREFARRTAPEQACIGVSPSRNANHRAQLDACKLAVVAAGKRAKAWTGTDRDFALLDVAAYYMTAAATDTYLDDTVGTRDALDKARMVYALVEIRAKRPDLRAAAASARMCIEDPAHCKTPKNVTHD